MQKAEKRTEVKWKMGNSTDESYNWRIPIKKNLFEKFKNKNILAFLWNGETLTLLIKINVATDKM